MNLIYWLLIFSLLLLSLPVMAVISLLILVDSGWPVVFSQKRIGKSGKPFRLYKFRTMVIGAGKLQKQYQFLNEAAGPVFKIREDPRFTQVGRFLSHTGLDELPQLVNVLRGEMALIGPRPLPVAEAKKLQAWQKKRQQVLPGIISPWVFEGYHRRSFNNWMKSDIDYGREKSAWRDLRLGLRTLVFMLKLLLAELRA